MVDGFLGEGEKVFKRSGWVVGPLCSSGWPQAESVCG